MHAHPTIFIHTELLPMLKQLSDFQAVSRADAIIISLAALSIAEPDQGGLLVDDFGEACIVWRRTHAVSLGCLSSRLGQGRWRLVCDRHKLLDSLARPLYHKPTYTYLSEANVCLA